MVFSSDAAGTGACLERVPLYSCNIQIKFWYLSWCFVNLLRKWRNCIGRAILTHTHTHTPTSHSHSPLSHSLTPSHTQPLTHSFFSFLPFHSLPFRFLPFLSFPSFNYMFTIELHTTFRLSIIHIISIHPDTMQQEWSPQLQPSTRRQGNDGATRRTEDVDSSYLQPTPGLERTPLGLKPVESQKHPETSTLIAIGNSHQHSTVRKRR